MPDASQFTLFLAAALLLAVTPGPDIFYVAARSLAGGRAEGFASSFGTGAGGMVHVVAGSVGVSALVLASAELFTALKLLGAVYLAWLGLRTILAARTDTTAMAGHDGAPPLGPHRAFRDGVMVGALNPKTGVFFLAFLPQFVDPAGSVPLQFIALGVVSVTLNTLVDLVVAYAAGVMRAGVGKRSGLVRRVRQASGAGMIALGLGLLLTRRPA